MCESGTSCNILMERAPFGCLTEEHPWYMITPMLKCVTPARFPNLCGIKKVTL